jgi:DNA polymerase
MTTYLPVQLRIVGAELRRVWRLYATTWKKCQACPLGDLATHHVLARGTIPCRVLFLGEAPGKTEDASGYPFVGPAGAVLEQLIIQCPTLHLPALPSFAGRSGLTWAIVNALVCAPWELEMPHVVDPRKRSLRQSLRTPNLPEIKACAPHVNQLLDLAQPEFLVLLGKVAQEATNHCPAIKEVPHVLHLQHPAFILRRGGASSVEFQRNLHLLRRTLQEHKS